MNDVFDFEAFHGGSNIYLSARDLHRWNASFFGRAADEQAKIGNAPSGLDLGSWYRSADGRAFSYAGHLQGFHDEVFRDLRSKRSIVYVSNNTLEPWVQHGLVRGIQRILAGEEQPPLQAPAVEIVRQEDLRSLEGRWELDGGEIVTIDSSASHLSVERNGVRYRMFQVRPNAFYVPGLDLVLGFSKDRIYHLTNFSEGWGRRAGGTARSAILLHARSGRVSTTPACTWDAKS